MQQLLSLAVLLGAVLQLQGCGGGTDPTSAPGTDAPTTPAPVANVVYEGSFTMAGLTLEEADTPEMKTAIAAGLAEAAGVDASAVEITGFEAARRLEGRRLSGGIKVNYKLTLSGAGGAAAAAAQVSAVTAALAADTFAATALEKIQAAIAASPDIDQAIKDKAADITITAFEAPVETTPVEGNSTRRLSFSFVTSDEPLIL